MTATVWPMQRDQTATWTAWDHVERPTRDRYQIDHVLASARLIDMATAVEVVTHGFLATSGSDHRPIRWQLVG